VRVAGKSKEVSKFGLTIYSGPGISTASQLIRRRRG